MTSPTTMAARRPLQWFHLLTQGILDIQITSDPIPLDASIQSAPLIPTPTQTDRHVTVARQPCDTGKVTSPRQAHGNISHPLSITMQGEDIVMTTPLNHRPRRHLNGVKKMDRRQYGAPATLRHLQPKLHICKRRHTPMKQDRPCPRGRLINHMFSTRSNRCHPG